MLFTCIMYMVFLFPSFSSVPLLIRCYCHIIVRGGGVQNLVPALPHLILPPRVLHFYEVMD
jgi:hypothetical protein